MPEEVVRHPEPTDGHDAELVAIRVPVPGGIHARQSYEELWARPVTAGRFRILSIPFQATDISPGDEVTAEDNSDGILQFGAVVVPAECWTFQVRCSSRSTNECRAVLETIRCRVIELGARTESNEVDKLAVSVSSRSGAQEVFLYLSDEEERGALQFEMTAGPREASFETHENPAYGDGADSFVYVPIPQVDDRPVAVDSRFEQLWARKVDQGRFLVCCIPFFAYDILPFDIVVATPDAENLIDYLVRNVEKFGGHYGFRVWLGGSSDRNRERQELEEFLTSRNLRREWWSRDFVAIDAPADGWEDVADHLWEKEKNDAFVYETVLNAYR